MSSEIKGKSPTEFEAILLNFRTENERLRRLINAQFDKINNTKRFNLPETVNQTKKEPESPYSVIESINAELNLYASLNDELQIIVNHTETI